jgi:hypothetical protein
MCARKMPRHFIFRFKTPSYSATMKQHFLASLLLLVSLTLPCSAQDAAQPPGIEEVKDATMTKKMIHYWSTASCFKLSDGSEPNVKEQCKEACFPGGVKSDVPPDQIIQSSQTCWYNGPESWFLTGKHLTDEEKKQMPRKSIYHPHTCIPNLLTNC